MENKSKSKRMSMIPNWRKISDDPVDRNVQDFILSTVRNRCAGVITNPDDLIQAFVCERRVLDVGVVEHDHGHMRNPEWRHKKVVSWASYCLGIDILDREIAMLKADGYNVALADATSDRSLGQLFERVVIGDVIEHVDDPIRLLRFCARHLLPYGEILVSTPNPYWILFLLESIRRGTYVANADHVRWVTPTMALEIGRRAGVELIRYYLYQPTGRSGVLKGFVNKIRANIWKNSELFTHSFIYVYRVPDESIV